MLDKSRKTIRDLPPKAKRNRIETGMEKVKGFF
jgi:hypothetical protein